ncbi:MAG: DUF4262 domain-containing protein [Planctomycetota bacterium]
MGDDDEIANGVREHGWQAISVFDWDPPFMYTVGLIDTFSHPEVITFGLQPPTAQRLLKDFVEGLRQGSRFDVPGVVDDPAFASVVGIKTVHESQYTRYLGYAMAFARRVDKDLAAVQALWPAKDGKLPFEVGCDEDTHRLQPRLDIPLTQSEKEEDRWMEDV